MSRISRTFTKAAAVTGLAAATVGGLAACGAASSASPPAKPSPAASASSRPHTMIQSMNAEAHSFAAAQKYKDPAGYRLTQFNRGAAAGFYTNPEYPHATNFSVHCTSKTKCQISWTTAPNDTQPGQ